MADVNVSHRLRDESTSDRSAVVLRRTPPLAVDEERGARRMIGNLTRAARGNLPTAASRARNAHPRTFRTPRTA